MIKVFEDFNFSRVGQLQSLLESQGIKTFLKNQFASSVMGEVPFVEVCPQLFILNDDDLQRAQQLLQFEQPESQPKPNSKSEPAGHWVCPGCSMDVESQFTSCWNCGLTPAVT